MLRVLILIVLATTVTTAVISPTSIRPAVGRTADRDPHLVEAASPRAPTLAMTIL